MITLEFRRLCFIAVLLTQTISSAYCQETNTQDVDELFRTARTKAFEKKYEDSRKILADIIIREPGYLEVRTFYARTFAWENRFGSARDEINKVLSIDPGNKEALKVAVDIELWSNNFESALTLVNRALNDHPNEEEFLLKRAQILNNLGQFASSMTDLGRVLTLNPGNTSAADLMKSIKSNHSKNSVAVFYGIDLFSRTFDPAHYSSIQLGRISTWGSGFVRVNQSYRFEKNGIQPEVDLYPRVTRNIYLYVNYAYSSSALFPRNRGGLEVNFKLPRNFETSAGFKFLEFESSKVIIYTASAGLYFGNYWISFRPYVIQSGSTATFSSSITFRKYFKDAESYLGFFGAAGYSPDDRRIQSSSGFSQDGIFRLGSQRVGTVWQRTLPGNWSFNVGLYLTHQELSFDQGGYMWISSGIWSLKKKF